MNASESCIHLRLQSPAPIRVLVIPVLEGTGAYGPLLLAPAEGLGSPSGPLTCGGNLF